MEKKNRRKFKEAIGEVEENDAYRGTRYLSCQPNRAWVWAVQFGQATQLRRSAIASSKRYLKLSYAAHSNFCMTISRGYFRVTESFDIVDVVKWVWRPHQTRTNTSPYALFVRSDIIQLLSNAWLKSTFSWRRAVLDIVDGGAVRDTGYVSDTHVRMWLAAFGWGAAGEPHKYQPRG